MTFHDTGARGEDGVTRIEASDAYGNMADGKHGTFFKFSPGFVSPVHSHTDDYAAVVIDGEMANYRPGETPVKLGPGSFWYQEGKQAHTTVCYSETGCLAFIIQGHRFDAQVPPVTEWLD
jgi:beta-alanine degradation protein BauB